MHRYPFEREEHAAIRQQLNHFARAQIAPHALAWEEAGEFPRALYKTAAEVGFLGTGYDESVGGSGGDFSHLIVASEALLLGGTSVGTCVGLGSHTIAVPPILRFGTQEQIDTFARPVISGDKIAALAITEPGGGSDVASLVTSAKRDGDHYVVNGQKTFITSGCRADFCVTAVRTGGKGHGGISLLIIESDTPGFGVSRKLDKMGWWASDTAEIFFDECRVPAANLLGHENAGFIPIMTNFVSERLLIAGQCVAIAELAYQESCRYAKERRAFGKTLMGFQVTRHKLADMMTKLATARAMTSVCVEAHLKGECTPASAAMAKNAATDMCIAVCDAAVQIHGGYGYMREYIVERLYRDARLYPIGGGTREIMNELIAKAEGY